MEVVVTEAEIQKLYDRLQSDAEQAGYHLNPDEGIAKDLVRGLIVNEKRHGYQGCPCRLSAGDLKKDLDIVCPCFYRDSDLSEFDMCYCALYVSGALLSGEKEAASIPERRPPLEQRQLQEAGHTAAESGVSGSPVNCADLSKPVWRCRVCGYLCGRDEPPEVCPICKAKKERFERFI